MSAGAVYPNGAGGLIAAWGAAWPGVEALYGGGATTGFEFAFIPWPAVDDNKKKCYFH